MSKKPEFKTPKLGDNVTPEMLVDDFGKHNEKRKVEEKAEGFYKTAIKARLEEGETVVNGEEFICIIEDCTRTTLDTKAIEEDMGAEWCEKYRKTTEYSKMTVKRK